MEEKLSQQPSSIIKIAVFGPESTGKTTLCQQLAAHFHEPYVAEFARNYLQNKWKTQGKICEPSDILPIAYGQMKLENQGAFTAKEFLFCDTNLLLTKVFSELTYGFCDPILDQAINEHQYDLFFLTDIDMPWQADDLRNKPESRKQDFEYFEKSLIENQKLYIKLSGDQAQRFQIATKAVLDLKKIKNLGLTSADFIQIHHRNIDVEKIQQQIHFFKTGIQKINLAKAAVINDGIFAPSESEILDFIAIFESNKDNFLLQKFVPASGAASRMFKFLTEFLTEYIPNSETINAYINRKKASEFTVFLDGIEKLPFYKYVIDLLEENQNYKIWKKDKRDYHFIKVMLKNFDFVNKPKGIIPFHIRNNKTVTALEEHLMETLYYATSNNISKLHFTIAEDQQIDFETIIKVKSISIPAFKSIQTDFSYQKQSTDTLAVGMFNNPLRDKNNQLVFRPGGHGALIDNLNQLKSDIIFIKNIDNVSFQNLLDTVKYKKLLAGILIKTQKQIFEYLKDFEKFEISEIEIFVTEKCHIILGNSYSKLSNDDKKLYLKSKLDRPIRVCGMVKNEGEPGGGPFWVLDKEANISLQIVESVQIDLDKNNQYEILKSSTHFNPVDLVCSIKNYRNEKFNLHDFVDTNTGFIVCKNKNGVDLKGFELPGLWNGAMSNWTTIFVEVPLVTFSPVKTVNDLLKPAHQNNE